MCTMTEQEIQDTQAAVDRGYLEWRATMDARDAKAQQEEASGGPRAPRTVAVSEGVYLARMALIAAERAAASEAKFGFWQTSKGLHEDSAQATKALMAYIERTEARAACGALAAETPL